MKVAKMIKHMFYSAVFLGVAGFTVNTARAELQPYYVEYFPVTGGYTRLFEKGDLNQQYGWVAIPDYVTIVDGPAGTIWENHTGVNISSMGLGFGFKKMAQSPQFGNFPANPDEDFIISTSVYFDDSRNTFYVTPMNYTLNTALTRLKFQAGGLLYVLVPDGFGGGDFVQVPDFTWQIGQTYSLHCEFHKEGVFALGINSTEIAAFESSVFAVGVEGIIFSSDNERIGSNMYVDRIRARRGIRDGGSVIDLLDPVPGLVDMDNVLEVGRATPMGTIWYIYGSKSGITTVPTCTGLSVNILKPRKIGSTIADENGNASITSYVPAGASGRRYLIQAIDTTSCMKSNLVYFTFQ